MKTVRWVDGREGHRRVLRPIDLERLGMTNIKETLVWEAANNFALVMNNKMSDSLVGKLPEEFVALSDHGDDESPEDGDSTTSLDQSASKNPEVSPKRSKGKAGDDDESSTLDADPEA